MFKAPINSDSTVNVNEITTTNINCLLCDNKSSTKIYELKDLAFSLSKTEKQETADFKVDSCNKCGFIFTNPQYSNSGYKKLFNTASASFGNSEGRPSEQADWIFANIKKNDLLIDIGCSDGRFLFATERYKIDGIGFEIDERNLEIAKNRAKNFKNKFRFNHLNQVWDVIKSIDLQNVTITLFHVLEHIPNPKEFLTNLRNIAKKNWKLVIEVPTIDLYVKNTSLNDISNFYSTQHTSHFSSKTLKYMLNMCGWKINFDFEMDDYNGYRIISKPDNKKDNFKFIFEEIKLDSEEMIKKTKIIIENRKQLIEKKVSNIVSKDLIIFGAGMHTELLYNNLRSLKNKKIILIDSENYKQGMFWRGINVKSPSEILKNDSNTPILLSSYGGWHSMKAYLIKNGFQNSIETLYYKLSSY